MIFFSLRGYFQTMKKLTLIFAAFICFQFSYSQNLGGLTIGLNAYRSLEVGSYFSPENKPIISPSVQFMVERKIVGPVRINFGLGFTIKGDQADYKSFKNEEVNMDYYEVRVYDKESIKKISLSYLELPINIVFSYKRLSFYAGPYIARGIFGKLKSEVNYTIVDDYGYYDNQAVSEVYETQLKTSKESGSPYFPGWDFGTQVGIRIQATSGLFIGAEYSRGMSVNEVFLGHTENGLRMYNRGLSLKLSYLGAFK